MNTKRYDDLKARATEMAWLLGQTRRYVPPGALATLIGYMFDPAVEQPTESSIAAAVARAEQADAALAAMREALEQARVHVQAESNNRLTWSGQLLAAANIIDAALATDAGAAMLERVWALECERDGWRNAADHALEQLKRMASGKQAERTGRLLRAAQSLHRAWRRERERWGTTAEDYEEDRCVGCVGDCGVCPTRPIESKIEDEQMHRERTCSDAHDEAVREEERNAIAAEVARAVADEREACAHVAATWGLHDAALAEIGRDIAAHIRARGTKEASNG